MKSLRCNYFVDFIIHDLVEKARERVVIMLEILTDIGNFGHPADLLHFMRDEQKENVHIHIRYCFEEVCERDMSLSDVEKWVRTYISPVAGSLQEAIKWLLIGLS